jgi:hypothetical protein
MFLSRALQRTRLLKMPLKQFSGLNNLGVKDDFGQQLTGEDFLPDQEAKYAEEKLK